MISNFQTCVRILQCIGSAFSIIRLEKDIDRLCKKKQIKPAETWCCASLCVTLRILRRQCQCQCCSVYSTSVFTEHHWHWNCNMLFFLMLSLIVRFKVRVRMNHFFAAWSVGHWNPDLIGKSVIRTGWHDTCARMANGKNLNYWCLLPTVVVTMSHGKTFFVLVTMPQGHKVRDGMHTLILKRQGKCLFFGRGWTRYSKPRHIYENGMWLECCNYASNILTNLAKLKPFLYLFFMNWKKQKVKSKKNTNNSQFLTSRISSKATKPLISKNTNLKHQNEKYNFFIYLEFSKTSRVKNKPTKNIKTHTQLPKL